jgi:hypothetical protein
MSEKDPLVPAGVASGRKRWDESTKKAFDRVPAWKKGWTTVSGASVLPLSGPDSQPVRRPRPWLAGRAIHPWRTGTGSPQTLDDASVRRVRHMKQTSSASITSSSTGRRGCRQHSTFRRFTAMTRPRDGPGRSQEVRRRDRFSRRHGGPVRPHRSQESHDVDDDQLDGQWRWRCTCSGRKHGTPGESRRHLRGDILRNTSRRRSTSSRRGPRCGW